MKKELNEHTTWANSDYIGKNKYLENIFSRDKKSDRGPGAARDDTTPEATDDIKKNEEKIRNNAEELEEYLRRFPKDVAFPTTCTDASYKNAVKVIFAKYRHIITNLVSNIRNNLYKILSTNDQEKIKLLNKNNKDYYDDLHNAIHDANEELSDLNSSSGKAYVTSFPFTLINRSTLTLTEMDSKFIFGDLRETFENIVNLEVELNETTYKTVGKMNGHISSLEKELDKLLAKYEKTGDPKIWQRIQQIKMELSRQKGTTLAATQDAKTDSNGGLGRDPLAEAVNPNDPNASLLKRKENLEITKQKENIQHEKKIERIDQSIEKVDQVIERSKAMQQQKKQPQETTPIAEALNTKEPESEDDEEVTLAAAAEGTKSPAEETKESENLQESVSKFEEMLFNGYSGDALKYFIRGEINNTNKGEIGVAKFIENDKEVKEVIKKIKWLLKKLSRSRDEKETYDMYIELKVQKNKFRTLFTQGKHRLEKQYK